MRDLDMNIIKNKKSNYITTNEALIDVIPFFNIDKSVGHSLKVLPEYFNAIVSGDKTFEIRKNDRDFQVGDKLILKEWDGKKYTGRVIKREITYILDDNSGYVMDGYVVMGIK